MCHLVHVHHPDAVSAGLVADKACQLGPALFEDAAVQAAFLDYPVSGVVRSPGDLVILGRVSFSKDMSWIP